jgi:hypothetical protein
MLEQVKKKKPVLNQIFIQEDIKKNEKFKPISNSNY